MKKKTFILIVSLLLLAGQSVLAGNVNRIGTAGATELLIPAGSRGSAL